MTIHNKRVFLKNLTYACVVLTMVFAEAQVMSVTEDPQEEGNKRRIDIQQKRDIIDEAIKIQERERERGISIRQEMPIIEEMTERFRDRQNTPSIFLKIFSKMEEKIRLIINE